MKQKRKKNVVIPALMDIGGGEFGKFEDYPDAAAFGDVPLAEILGVTRMTISRWRRDNVIPFQRRRGYCEYNVLDVVNALKKHGYSQDNTNNPLK